jgi:hypothetical protein
MDKHQSVILRNNFNVSHFLALFLLMLALRKSCAASNLMGKEGKTHEAA